MRTLIFVGALGVLISCGQDPSFIDLKRDDEDDERFRGKNGVVTSDQEQGVFQEDELPQGVDDSGSEAQNTENMDQDSSENTLEPEDFIFEGVEDEQDQQTLRKCMEKWDSLPFDQRIQVRKIYASVTVGGVGNAINDTRRTSEPELVLIYAGVNVLGSVTYKLLNPNGFYCMKVNVNVLTSLNLDLHCNARLADSMVDVNVGSEADQTASVGVHVGSIVVLNTIRPDGDSCIR